MESRSGARAVLRVHERLQVLGHGAQMIGAATAAVVRVRHRSELVEALLARLDGDDDHLVERAHVPQLVDDVVEAPGAVGVRAVAPHGLAVLRVEHGVPLVVLLAVARRHAHAERERAAPGRSSVRMGVSTPLLPIEGRAQHHDVTAADDGIPADHPRAVGAHELHLHGIEVRDAQPEGADVALDGVGLGR